MKTKRPMKKEARVARIEALPGKAVLVVIFRGGWIDGVAGLKGGGIPDEVMSWLAGSKYSQELKGISLGDGLEDCLGAGGPTRLREWARSRGLPEVVVGTRNRRQARVLAEGFGRLLEGKG